MPAEKKTFEEGPGTVRDGINLEHGDQVILNQILWLRMSARSLIERAGRPRD